MANFAFNVAKGQAKALVDANPGAGVIILLKVAEADDTLKDYADLESLLASAGNTEADFTNYSRKTGLTFTASVDNIGNLMKITVSSPQTWSSAGGVSNNNLVKAIFAVQTGDGDDDVIPLSAHDFVVTTSGVDLSLSVGADGFYRARDPS